MEMNGSYSPKCTFIRWEKLRILYNILLVVFVFALFRRDITDPVFWPDIMWVLVKGAIVANAVFFAGPVIEILTAKSGLRHKAVTISLFVAITGLVGFLAFRVLLDVSLALGLGNLD
jgi:hypothetical protein